MAGSSKDLLNSDEDVQRWHANLARSGRITADCRVRRPNMFLKNTWITRPGWWRSEGGGGATRRQRTWFSIT